MVKQGFIYILIQQGRLIDTNMQNGQIQRGPTSSNTAMDHLFTMREELLAKPLLEEQARAFHH
jgi:hypothetical protein